MYQDDVIETSGIDVADFFSDDIGDGNHEKILKEVSSGVIVSPAILRSTMEQSSSKPSSKPLPPLLLSSQPKFVLGVNLQKLQPRLSEYSKGFVPENTASSTNRNFSEWVNWRNGHEDPDEHVPVDLLLKGLPADLNKYLSLYVMETRNKQYPTRTINLLLAGIRRYMLSMNPHAVNILDEKNADFAGLQGVRDRVSRELRQEGIECDFFT